MSQCHNVTIAQLSKCIVTHNVTIALHLDQNASHLYCKQSVFWIVSISGSNNIRNKLTEKVYILERFTSHKCSSRSTFEKVLKGEYELSTRALSGWMLMICTVWFGVTLDEHGLQSRLTWWHWRHLGNLVTQAAATRRVTSKHVYDRSHTPNDTRTAKGTTPICVSKASWNSLKKSLMNRHSSAISTF